MTQSIPHTAPSRPLRRAEPRRASDHRNAVSPEEMERHVAARIRYRRVTLDLSLAEFAMLQGVTCEQARGFEMAEGRVSAGRLARIAASFRTDLSWFFEGLGVEMWPHTRRGRAIEGEMIPPSLIKAALRKLGGS